MVIDGSQARNILELYKGASPQEKLSLIVDVKDAMRSLEAPDPGLHFPVHDQQDYFRTHCDYDINIMEGGNRSGKSVNEKIILADVGRRRSPINDRLCVDPETGLAIRSRNRPLEMWVATPSLEKFRNDWLDTKDPRDSIKAYLGDMLQRVDEHPDIVLRTTLGDKILAKSYEQGYMSFESSDVDVIFLDEEPDDPKILNSCLMRVATNNGVIILGFTPLEGLSWTFDRFYDLMVNYGMAKKVRDRVWVSDDEGGRSVLLVQMGMADNPKARREAEKLEKDETILPAEKRARLYGEYGFQEGVFLPRLAGLNLEKPAPEHEMYVIDELPDHLEHYLIADPNQRYGAILAAMDMNDNAFFIHQHLEEAWVIQQHADLFNLWLRSFPGARMREFADFGAAGKMATNEINKAHGFRFQSVVKGKGSVEESIKVLRAWSVPQAKRVHPITGERGAPQMYFYRPGLIEKLERNGREVMGSRLVDELSRARQTETDHAKPETPHKTQKFSLDLFDCARYLTRVRRPAGIPASGNQNAVGIPIKKAPPSDRLPTRRELNDREGRVFDPMRPRFPSPLVRQ
jgi:phage terminase large subunit-like protein